MKNQIGQVNIAAIVGIVILLVAIPAGVYLSQNTQIFKPRASSGDLPDNIRHTCAADGTSVKVVWDHVFAAQNYQLRVTNPDTGWVNPVDSLDARNQSVKPIVGPDQDGGTVTTGSVTLQIQPNKQYNVDVQVNPQGNRNSIDLTCTPVSKPTQPNITSASCTNGVLNVSWSGGGPRYEVRVAKDLTEAETKTNAWNRDHTAAGDFTLNDYTSTSIAQNMGAANQKYTFWIHSDNNNVLSDPVYYGSQITCAPAVAKAAQPRHVKASCDASGKVTVEWDSDRGVTFAVRGLVGNVDNNTQASTSPNISNGDERNGAINSGITASNVTDTSAHYTYVSSPGQAQSGQSVRMWVVGYSAGAFGTTNSDPSYAPVATCAVTPPAPVISSASCDGTNMTLTWPQVRGLHFSVRGAKGVAGNFNPGADWTSIVSNPANRISNGTSTPGTDPSNSPGVKCDGTNCTFSMTNNSGFGTIANGDKWRMWVSAGNATTFSDPGLYNGGDGLVTCAPTSLPKPGPISAICTGGTLKVAWSAPAGGMPSGTGYDLRIDRDPTNGSALPTEDASWAGRNPKVHPEDEFFDNLPSSQTDYTKTGISPGQKYQVWVQTRHASRGIASEISYSTEISCAPAVTTTKVRIAESDAGLDNAAQYREYPWQNPMKISYTFRNTNAGAKPLFVRFYPSDGSTPQRIIAPPISLGTNPPPPPPPGTCTPGIPVGATGANACVGVLSAGTWQSEYKNRPSTTTTTDWSYLCPPADLAGGKQEPGVGTLDWAIFKSEYQARRNACTGQ